MLLNGCKIHLTHPSILNEVSWGHLRPRISSRVSPYCVIVSRFIIVTHQWHQPDIQTLQDVAIIKTLLAGNKAPFMDYWTDRLTELLAGVRTNEGTWSGTNMFVSGSGWREHPGHGALDPVSVIFVGLEPCSQWLAGAWRQVRPTMLIWTF